MKNHLKSAFLSAFLIFGVSAGAANPPFDPNILQKAGAGAINQLAFDWNFWKFWETEEERQLKEEERQRIKKIEEEKKLRENALCYKNCMAKAAGLHMLDCLKEGACLIGCHNKIYGIAQNQRIQVAGIGSQNYFELLEEESQRGLSGFLWKDLVEKPAEESKNPLLLADDYEDCMEDCICNGGSTRGCHEVCE